MLENKKLLNLQVGWAAVWVGASAEMENNEVSKACDKLKQMGYAYFCRIHFYPQIIRGHALKTNS